MKIYSADGSYTENVRDTDFGWFLNDVENREEEKMEQRNRDEKKQNIIHVHPNIEIYGVENAIECRENPENMSEKSAENIDAEYPSKEDIANLIEPYTIQSGTLLSVISNAKLLTYKSKYLQLFITARASAYRYLIKDKEEIKKIVDDFNSNRSEPDSPFSLLLEIIFTDKSSPIDYFLFNTKANESGALLRSLLRQHSQENFGRMRTETDSGVDDSISSCNSELRNEVLEMHQSFESMNTTVERLIEKAEKLEKDLIQTTYLDDLLHLLNGNIEKVKTIKLPFKAFVNETNEETVNLVI